MSKVAAPYSGATVSVPVEAIEAGPYIQWDHIDGPLMTWAGQMHWLTWGERLALTVRYKTADEIAASRFPNLQRIRSNLEQL